MKLIILGDAATMTRHPFYKKLYDHIMKANRPYGAADDGAPVDSNDNAVTADSPKADTQTQDIT